MIKNPSLDTRDTINAKLVSFQRTKKFINTYSVCYDNEQVEFYVDDLEDINVSVDSYYFIDKYTKKKKVIGTLQIDISKDPRFDDIKKIIKALIRQYFGKNTFMNYNTIFIKIPLEENEKNNFSVDKFLQFSSKSKIKLFPVKLKNLKQLVKNYAKSFKLVLKCFTINQDGIRFETNSKHNSSKKSVEIPNNYVNFNFAIKSIDLGDVEYDNNNGDNENNTLVKLLKNIQQEYGEYLNKKNGKLLINTQEMMTNKKRSVKKVTKKMLLSLF